MPLNVKIESTLKENLDEILKEAILDGCIQSTNEVMNSAVENCPVDTGNLRNSIHSNINEEEVHGEVGTNVEYAPYQEFGTSKMKAANNGKGIFRPALYDNADLILKIFNSAIQRLLK